MRPLGLVITLSFLGLLVATSVAISQEQAPRAKHRQFDEATTSIIFFKDVFAEALQGERPAALSQNSQAPAGMNPSSSSGGDMPSAKGGTTEWAKIISPTTIQDEVKRLNSQLLETVQNVRKFNGGGFEDARRDYTELAMLFEIIAQYNGDVRWKDDALVARDLFARAGFNSKVGTDNSFNEAKGRSRDLEELVRGTSLPPQDGPEPDPGATWDAISDRPPLMQRLEIAFDKRVKKMTANEGEFNSNIEDILHEAEIIAAIGHAMQKEGFEYYDDEDYVGYSQQMQDAALAVVQAVKDNNADAARKAAGDVGQACSVCHESYR